eukprot:scaffold11_cov257-Pinguiococcus_pyrenoidosus.AAC.5
MKKHKKNSSHPLSTPLSKRTIPREKIKHKKTQHNTTCIKPKKRNLLTSFGLVRLPVIFLSSSCRAPASWEILDRLSHAPVAGATAPATRSTDHGKASRPLPKAKAPGDARPSSAGDIARVWKAASAGGGAESVRQPAPLVQPGKRQRGPPPCRTQLPPPASLLVQLGTEQRGTPPCGPHSPYKHATTEVSAGDAQLTALWRRLCRPRRPRGRRHRAAHAKLAARAPCDRCAGCSRARGTAATAAAVPRAPYVAVPKAREKGADVRCI